MDNEQLTDHDYDGIQEFDNPLPAWWLWTFLFTIIFGFHYWLHYSIAGGPTQLMELKRDMSKIESLQKNAPVSAETDEVWAKLLASDETKQKGQAVFAAKCAACHGPELQGVIGPNLTDDYWLHGKGKPADIMSVVRSGVPEKGMPSWEAQLSHPELQAVVAFIKSKHGSHPANPKPPQGDKVED